MNTEISKVIERYQHVVNTQNKEDFDELFAKNCQVSLISIVKEFKGKESVYQDFLVGGIQKAYSSIELINDGLTINQISDSLAIAIFKYHTVCIRRESGEEYGISGLETQVIVKEDGIWRIAHVHYSK